MPQNIPPVSTLSQSTYSPVNRTMLPHVPLSISTVVASRGAPSSPHAQTIVRKATDLSVDMRGAYRVANACGRRWAPLRQGDRASTHGQQGTRATLLLLNVGARRLARDRVHIIEPDVRAGGPLRRAHLAPRLGRPA